MVTILTLTILLAAAVRLTFAARRHRKKAEATNKKLEGEIAERQRSDQALCESHKRMSAILDTALDGIVTMDHEGRIAEFNPAAERIFGVRRSEVIGQPLAEVIIPPDMRAQHREGFARYLATGEARVLGKRIEVTGLRADGSTVALELNINRMPGDGPPMFAAFLRDISQRKLAEQATRENQQLIEGVINNTTAVIYVKDLAGRYVLVNRQFERLFHTTQAQIIGRTDYDLFTKEQADVFRAMDQQVATSGKVVEGEEVAPLDDGPHTYLSIKFPICDVGGKPRAVGGISTDISERKRALAAQALLAGIVESSDDAIYSKTLDRVVTSWNPGAERMFGYSAAEIVGQPDWLVVPPECAAQEDGIFARIRRGERIQSQESVRMRKDGERVQVSLSISPLRDEAGNITGVSKIARDITGRKRAEEALRASEERFRTMADGAPVLIWVSGTDKLCTWFNSQWLEFTGRAMEQELGNGWADNVHPDDHDRCWQIYSTAFDARVPFTMEYRLRRHDGAWRIVLDHGIPLYGAQREFAGYIGSCVDLTERLEAERKLQTQLERLNLLDQITRAIGDRQDLSSVFQVTLRSLEESLALDFGCVCLYEPMAEALTVASVAASSEALAADMGLSEHSKISIDKNGLARCVNGQLIHEPDVSQSDFPFPQRLSRGGLRSMVAAPLLSASGVFGILLVARRQPNSFSSGDCEFLRQLSGHVALAAHQAQIYSALQQAYDDLRQTQQAAMQQERLRALGQMASGIAHDINNALSPVALYTETLLEREPNLSVRTRQYLETTQRALDDVGHTVARMQEFYRRREPQLVLGPVQMNRMIPQVLELTRARWSDMPQQRGIVVQIQTDLAADLPPVPGVESEIREALVNLVFNAVDAMPDGGTLTVRTRASQFESPSQAVSQTGRQVYVDVEDTGIGMDEETRRRCLEPFFTTKGDRGTGLGLAMVFGVMKRHNAEVEIESAAGLGTTMRLIFPAASVAAGAVQASTPYPVAARLRILVVDDDPLTIKSLSDTLEADGHSVVTAAGGQAGIDAFRAAEENGERFSVVITDLGMPRVDGRQVASAVKNLRRSTVVLLVTGWGQRLVAEGDVPPDVDRVLNKPPKLRDLRTALAELAAVSRPARA